MVYAVQIPEAVTQYLQFLDYEWSRRQDILRYLAIAPIRIDDESVQNMRKSAAEAYICFFACKEEIEKLYIPDGLRKPGFSWRLDYASSVLSVTKEENSASAKA